MISCYDLLGGDAVEMLLISSESTVNHLNVSSLTLTFDIQVLQFETASSWKLRLQLPYAVRPVREIY